MPMPAGERPRWLEEAGSSPLRDLCSHFAFCLVDWAIYIATQSRAVRRGRRLQLRAQDYPVAGHAGQLRDMTAPSALAPLWQMQQGSHGQAQGEQGPGEDPPTAQRASNPVWQALGDGQSHMLAGQLGATPGQAVGAPSVLLAPAMAAATETPTRAQVQGQQAAAAAGEPGLPQSLGCSRASRRAIMQAHSDGGLCVVRPRHLNYWPSLPLPPPPPFQACIPRPMLLLLLLLPGAWGPRVSSINFCSCRRRVRRSSSLPAPRAFYPRCRRLWLGRLPRCQVLRCRTNLLAKRCQKPLQHISVATMTAPCSSAKR